MDFFSLLLLLFVMGSAMQPMLQERALASKRARKIAQIERERGTRVITMIHREERRQLFSIPVARMIDMEDAQDIIPAIQSTPPGKPIDLVLHTPGGLLLAAMQIARAVKAHPSKVTVHVPVYAMSGGTLIALAADEIALEPFSVLGPIDPQIAGFPAVSFVEVKNQKPIEEVSDFTLVLASMGEKALAQLKKDALDLVDDRVPMDQAERMVEALAGGRWTHDYALTAKEAKQLGLNVLDGIPASILELTSYYPQPVRQLPSVEFIPTSPRTAPMERDGRA